MIFSENRCPARIVHRLECDEDKGRFEAKLGKIAKATPKAK
jgi:hypothetical protein